MSRLTETGRVNQAEAAAFFGMTVQGFAKWLKRVGIEPDDKEGTQLLYLGSDLHRARLSEQLEKLKPEPVYSVDDDGDVIDVEQERAKKLKAERIAQELKNAEMMGELAPIDLLLSALRDALQTANQWLESVPALIKRANPEISGTALDKIERECAKVRNSIADGRIDFTDDRMSEFREKPRFEDEADA